MVTIASLDQIKSDMDNKVGQSAWATLRHPSASVEGFSLHQRYLHSPFQEFAGVSSIWAHDESRYCYLSYIAPSFGWNQRI